MVCHEIEQVENHCTTITAVSFGGMAVDEPHHRWPEHSVVVAVGVEITGTAEFCFCVFDEVHLLNHTMCVKCLDGV